MLLFRRRQLLGLHKFNLVFTAVALVQSIGIALEVEIKIIFKL